MATDNYRKEVTLSPQQKKIYRHMKKAGGISALDAMVTYGITSASLARRICDMEAIGFKIKRQKRQHPISGKEYTRYALDTAVKLKVAA